MIRKLFVFLLVLVILLVGLTFYFQTRHAFRHIILPLVARLLPGELRVGDGSLRFPATLGISGVSYTDTTRGLSLEIDRLLVRVSVPTSIRERLVVIEEAELDGGRVQVSREPGSTPPRVQAESTDGSPAHLPPIGLRRISLSNLALRLQNDAQVLALRDLEGSIRDLELGRTGTIELRSGFRFEDEAGHGRWAAELRISGTLEPSSDGRRLTWNGGGEARFLERPGEGSSSDAKPFILEETMTGHYDAATRTLEADAALAVRQGDAPLGRAFLQWSRTDSTGLPVTDVGITVSELSDKMLDLWLKRAESFRISSTHLSGYVKIRSADERYEVRSTLTAQNLQAVVGKQVTPPLDLDLAQAGTFDLDMGAGILDIFQVRIADRHRVWLMGELSDSLSVELGSESHESASQSSAQGEWRASIGEIDVQELRPWADALGWGGLEGLRAGRLGGSAVVSGHGEHGALDLDLRLRMSDVRLASADRHTAAALMTFAHDIHATISDLTRLRLGSWTTTASMDDRPVGTVRLSGFLNLSDPTGDRQLEGSLQLADLPGEALNPFLSLWTPVRFDRTRFSGTGDVTLSGDRMDWTIDLRGHQFSLHLPTTAKPTSPLELELTTSGGYDLRSQVLRLNRLALREMLQKRLVIAASLDNPIQFTLGESTTRQRSGSGGGSSATFTVDVHHLEISDLRPRLAAWGVSTLDAVKTGALDGHWTAYWLEESQALSVSGTLDLTRFRLHSGRVRLEDPVEIRSRIEGTLTGFSALEMKRIEIDALNGSRVLASVKFTGTTHLRDTTTQLAATFISDSLPRFADRFGLLDARQRSLVDRGRLRVDAQLARPGDNQPISIQATVEARDIRFQPIAGQYLTYSFLGEAGGVVRGDPDRIELKSLSMAVQSHGREAGKLHASGAWPFAATSADGRLTVQTTDLDIGPFIDLAGYLPGRLAGPLPVIAQVTLAQGGGEETLRLRGQETIGPIQIDAQRDGDSDTTFGIQHDLIWSQDGIGIADLTVTADRHGGRSDRIVVNGQASTSGPPIITLKGDLVSLDAGWYATLFEKRTTERPHDKAQSAKDLREDHSDAGSTLAVLMNLDADLAIGSISYRRATVGPGRLIAKGTGTRVDAELRSTRFADGQIEATMSLTQLHNEARLAWSGKGQNVAVETILRMIEPGREPRLKGSGAFTTEGTGRVNAEPFVRQLDGTVRFDITEGQFLRAPLLQFLSEYTHAETLAHMGFDHLQGVLRLEEGWLKADSLTAAGPLATLEGNLSISPENIVDGRIFAKIGPSLAKTVAIPCMSGLLKTPDGFMTLPFAVRITGVAPDPSFSVDTAAWDYAKGTFTSLADTMKNLLRGCRDRN